MAVVERFWKDSKALIVGNWKMNGLSSSLELLRELREILNKTPRPDVSVLVCPPATLLSLCAREMQGSRIHIGAQSCHSEEAGAFTGDLSASMLKDAGAEVVLIGHSERRQGHGESNAMVAAQAGAAWRAGLTPLLCLGETHSERTEGRVFSTIAAQLSPVLEQWETQGYSPFLIAYEPVWAIGSGQTPSCTAIAEIHSFLRATLQRHSNAFVPLLYGGSVKPENTHALLAVENVNGLLVGGASLQAHSFVQIIQNVPPLEGAL